MKRLLVFVFTVALLGSCNNSQQNQRVIELLEKIDEKLDKTNEEIDSVEYKTVFVELESNISSNYFLPEHGDNYEKAELKVTELLNNGWQIISTSAVTRSAWNGGLLSHTASYGHNIHLIKHWKKKDLELLKEKEKIKLDSIRKVETEAAEEPPEVEEDPDKVYDDASEVPDNGDGLSF